MPIERKSAAIMFTDIAGYTETMSESEQKALDMLRRKRSILKPLIDSHQGTYVKEIGDDMLSYFESGYNASACAKEFQKEIHSLTKEAESMPFELNYRFYELLEDKSYLETAYNQVQEKVSEMDEELGSKFLGYPLIQAIVEVWETLNGDKN